MKKGFFKILMLFTFLMIFIPIKVDALTFKVEKSVDTVKPGGEVTVYIKATDVDASDSVQTYEIKL